MKMQYVTPSEVAKALGYNVDSLRQLAKQGEPDSINLNARWTLPICDSGIR